MTQYIKDRLEYLRKEIEAERISLGEIAELQALTEHIEPGDVLLLQWAGVPEFPENENQAIIDEIGDDGIVLADGRALKFDELSKILNELADHKNDNLPASSHFRAAAHYLNYFEKP